MNASSPEAELKTGDHAGVKLVPGSSYLQGGFYGPSARPIRRQDVYILRDVVEGSSCRVGMKSSNTRKPKRRVKLRPGLVKENLRK